MKNLKPLSNRIVVEMAETSGKTAGGLYIPGTTEPQQIQGKVLAVGPGKRNSDGTLRSVDVKKGDIIIFPAFSGTDLQSSGKKYRILVEDEVLGVLQPE